MSKRNQMPGLRQKGGIWHIEKRCKYCESGWLRESTETSSRTEAQEYLISRLAELKEEAQRKSIGVFTFEEAAMRYIEDIAHKSSADTAVCHIDQLLPYIGHLADFCNCEHRILRSVNTCTLPSCRFGNLT